MPDHLASAAKRDRWAATNSWRAIFRRLPAIMRGFDAGLDAVVGLLLVGIVGISLLQVLMRYGFDRPLPWPETVVRWLFLWLVFLGAAVAVRVGGHIRVEMLVDSLSGKARPVVELLTTTLTALALGLLAVEGFEHAQATSLNSPVLHMSQRYLFLAIPVGSALTLVNLARRRVNGVRPLACAAAVMGGALASVWIGDAPWDTFEEVGPTLVVMGVGLALMALGMPIAYALILAAFFAFWTTGLPSAVVITRLTSTISNDFVLIAIPLFVLMGALMNVGGITTALIRAAATLVGHWRGGLGQVNVLTNAMLGGLSGSSSADAAAVTKTLVPEMEKHGYDRAYAGAITASSSLLANLLPPSIAFLIFASLASVSVGALFMAGVVPAVLTAGALMLTVFVMSTGKRYSGQGRPRASLREVARALGIALPALSVPVVILGVLRGGVVTPTEAGAVAVLIALFLGVFVYRAARPAHVLGAIAESSREASVILLLIAGSAPIAWLLLIEGVPQTVVQELGAIADHKVAFLLLLNLSLLIIGLPLEAAPAMVIIVPLLMPIAAAVGIDPIHLGVVVVFNLILGSLTPPVGVLAFIPATIAKVPVMKVFAALIWFDIVMVMVLLLLTFIPGLSLWLPRALGL